MKNTENALLAHPSKIATMSGLSLGGQSVITSLVDSDVVRNRIQKAYTFNAWGTSDRNTKQKQKLDSVDINKLQTVLYHYRTKDDGASKWMNRETLGTVLSVEQIHDDPHSIYNFYDPSEYGYYPTYPIEKIQMMIATIVMDIVIVFRLRSGNLNKFDTWFAGSLIPLHILFIISLAQDLFFVLRILHLLIAVYLAISPLLTDQMLLLNCLGLVCLIQILWCTEGCCILDRVTNTCDGDGTPAQWGAMLVTIILVLKLFSKLKLFDFINKSTK